MFKCPTFICKIDWKINSMNEQVLSKCENHNFYKADRELQASFLIKATIHVSLICRNVEKVCISLRRLLFWKTFDVSKSGWKCGPSFQYPRSYFYDNKIVQSRKNIFAVCQDKMKLLLTKKASDSLKQIWVKKIFLYH